MTDRFTEDLFSGTGTYGATMLVNRISRLVMDPERFPDDKDEPMSAKGMGAVYTRTSAGEDLRTKSFRISDRQAVMDDLYWPYSSAFRNLVTEQLDQFGSCLIIDGHSFPSKALPYENANLVRPDICFGYELFHEPSGLVDILEDFCRRKSMASAKNEPFSGSYVPIDYFHKDERVNSIMIEVNRSLYMDEVSGTKSVHYDQLRAVIKQLIELTFSY